MAAVPDSEDALSLLHTIDPPCTMFLCFATVKTLALIVGKNFHPSPPLHLAPCTLHHHVRACMIVQHLFVTARPFLHFKAGLSPPGCRTCATQSRRALTISTISTIRTPGLATGGVGQRKPHIAHSAQVCTGRAQASNVRRNGL